MNNITNITVVCPGSFDPVTVGHLDIIRRASQMFSKVIVLVSINRSKKPSFTVEERVAMLKKVTEDIPNVEVDSYDGLLADYTKKGGAKAIIKGLRAMSDFEYEFQMALTNKKLNPNAETMFFSSSAENMYLSSSMVKLIASMGGDVTDFIPKTILNSVVERLKRKDG